MSWVNRAKITLESSPGLSSWLPALQALQKVLLPTRNLLNLFLVSKHITSTRACFCWYDRLWLVSKTTGCWAKMVVCWRGKTAMSRMTCTLQICTVQQHLYGSSLPSFPSWCGCGQELIPETTTLGAMPMAATISNANVTWKMQAIWAGRAFQPMPTALCYSSFFPSTS